MSKLISVIMGIYNCADTLPEAIDSILKQTYTNWELILCDDYSTDNTLKIAEVYKEKYPDKIVITRNKENHGLAYSLNQCLPLAKGTYIARMDGDDISTPDRFEKQVNYLEKHPQCNLVGSLMQRFNETGLHDVQHKMEHPDKYSLRYSSSFFHATIMTYKYVYDSLHGYVVAPRTRRAEDYDLWFRFFAQGYQGATIQEVLYHVREDENAIRRRTRKARLYAVQNIIHGFNLLHYPKCWMIKPILESLIKMLIPYSLIDLYRNYQSKHNNN